MMRPITILVAAFLTSTTAAAGTIKGTVKLDPAAPAKVADRYDGGKGERPLGSIPTVVYLQGAVAGHILRAEAFHDTWEVPKVWEEPVDISWYIEARQRFGAGYAVAARYGEIRFNILKKSVGPPEPWDWDVRRWELALGWRTGRHTEWRAQYQWTRDDGPEDEPDNLFALQRRWFY